MRILKTLNTAKSGGPDGIQLKIIKISAYLIAKPISDIYMASWYSGIFPSRWKVSHVIPIPKSNKAGKRDTEDFRPTSINDTLSEIMKKLVLHNLVNKYYLYTLYPPNQFGFRKGSNATCAIISIHKELTKSLDKKGIVGATIATYDLRKAFDSVPHKDLMQCLRATSLPKGFIAWYCSFLDNRTFKVKLNCTCSDSFQMTSGVP